MLWWEACVGPELIGPPGSSSPLSSPKRILTPREPIICTHHKKNKCLAWRCSRVAWAHQDHVFPLQEDRSASSNQKNELLAPTTRRISEENRLYIYIYTHPPQLRRISALVVFQSCLGPQGSCPLFPLQEDRSASSRQEKLLFAPTTGSINALHGGVPELINQLGPPGSCPLFPLQEDRSASSNQKNLLFAPTTRRVNALLAGMH